LYTNIPQLQKITGIHAYPSMKTNDFITWIYLYMIFHNFGEYYHPIIILGYTRIQVLHNFGKHKHTGTSKQETHVNHHTQSSRNGTHMFCLIQTHMYINKSIMKYHINHHHNFFINLCLFCRHIKRQLQFLLFTMEVASAPMISLWRQLRLPLHHFGGNFDSLYFSF